MLKFARISHSLVALSLFAALASTAPLVHWCPSAWSEVTVEDFAACSLEQGECGRPGPAPNLPPCAGQCPVEPEQGRDRAYCLDAPLAGTQGAGATRIETPAAWKGLPDAGVLPEPAGVASEPITFEPFRPYSRPGDLPPPARGPPVVT